MPNDDEVIAAALALAPAAKAKLADQLLASLEDPSARDAIDAAWVDECRARLRAHEEGRVRGVPADEVFAAIRARRPA